MRDTAGAVTQQCGIEVMGKWQNMKFSRSRCRVIYRPCLALVDGQAFISRQSKFKFSARRVLQYGSSEAIGRARIAVEMI